MAESFASRMPPGLASPHRSRSRTQSISSDRPSTVSQGIMFPTLSVSPDAAFIAASAASQIVTNDHDSHADLWYDQIGIEPAGETVLVSNAALKLVNNFLDYLLFSFLHKSKATTLTALRPSVSEVLKPKLAQDAINNADEELREYLGGGDEDDYMPPQRGDAIRDWDLELVWKRTRLRCMVYSSLGDLEEEDEDYFMEQENLGIGVDEQISDVISPAVAIFLTSVMEYMGELTLTVSGQAAFHRMRNRYEKELKNGTRTFADIADRVVVEESDMERVALDRTLGRLWRGWKKRTKQPIIYEFGHRPYSAASQRQERHDGHVTEAAGAIESPDLAMAGDRSQMTPEIHVEDDAANHITEPLDAETVPLPMTERDVDEIEVPGLAHNSDDEAEDDDEEQFTQRPRSLLLSSLFVPPQEPATSDRPTPVRKRSASQPVPARARFAHDDISEEELDHTDGVATGVLPVSPLSEDGFPQDTPAATHPHSDKQGLNIVTDMSAPAESSIIGLAQTTQDKDLTSEYDAEAAAYEEAEIMTSARVSVSNSPVLDNLIPKKSPSVRSARIVALTGSKPTSSPHSPSMDATDYSRSNNDSRASSYSNKEETRSKTVENGASSGSPNLVSSIERMRSSMRSSSPISESGEEEADIAPKTYATQPWAHDEMSMPAASYSPPRNSSRHQANTKVTVLNSPNYTGPFVERNLPEVPPKSPSRQGRRESHGVSSMERARTRDSDELSDLPLHPTTSRHSRQLHTSGSSGSSGASRLKPVRTSEEHAPNKAESVARNFEELIHSNQTITYTLTPEHMRAMDTNRPAEGPILHKLRTKGDDSRSRSGSSPTESRGFSKLTSGGSYSPTDARNQRPTPISIPNSAMPSSTKAGGVRSPLNVTTPKSAGPQSPAIIKSPADAKPSRTPSSVAREARVPSGSTRDFAEFIKATGPLGDNKPAPLRVANGPGGSINSPVNSPSAASPTAHGGNDPRRTSTNNSRLRYQPREAVADGRSETNDLADFIRQGPPGASVNRNGRQVSGAIGNKGVDTTIHEVRHSRASTNATETGSMPSVQSSIHSHSALLKNKSPNVPSKMFEEEDMMPKRKTRRVKDPYAIDFSDEDDDDDFIAPKPPVKKEESLAEFLRNYDPPPEPPSVQIPPKLLRKKSSAPSLINRLTRSNKEPKESASPVSKVSPDAQSLSSRGGSKTNNVGGYIPIQVNMPGGYDKYGMKTESSGTSQRNASSGGGSSGRVPMKRFEPREAVPTPGRTPTSELAAFLRDSAPPPSAPSQPALREEESSSLSRMFGRRKKPVA